MTRGIVKSRLMYERKWVIRSQAPFGERFIDYKVVGASLRYSQASMETLQDNIVLYVTMHPFLKIMILLPSNWSNLFE
jgi:hypothetical protein